VKTWAKIIAFGFTFLVGVGFGLGAYRLYVLGQAFDEGKTRWFVCRLHQDALYDRADQFHQKYGHWPTNVQELVKAHFLPEYSEVHFCPSQIGTLTRTDYEGSAWVDQNQTGLVAYYSSSPYRFQVVSNKFTVICTFDKSHTQ
jgi:hypothetical protein